MSSGGRPYSPLPALLTTAALVGVPYLVPGLGRLRLLTPLPEGAALVVARPPEPAAAPEGETQVVVETRDEGETGQVEPAAIPAAARAVLPPEDKPPRPIEDAPEGAPEGGPRFLDAFYEKLDRVERREPGAIARISYYGDSIVATDFVTGTLRRKLQRRYGDAGHGFMLVANAWPGYAHNDVVRYAAPGWKVSRVVGPYAKDGLYGLGGVSFRSEGAGLISRFETTKKGDIGRKVSRFVVDYLEHPGGGPLEVKIDGEPRPTIDTKGPAERSALARFEVPEGDHRLELRVAGPGVRAFGVWMENDGPGVVLDALGIQGARIRFLDKSDDAHWAEQLKLRDPSLVAFQYGMNESEDGELYPLVEYEATMKAVLEQVKRALPEASCLLVGPMDRADKRGSGYSSRPVVPKLAAIQRKVAMEVGCGYFDTYGAMGGRGSMGIWVQRGLGAADLAHPSGAGAEVIGGWVYLALVEGFEAYKARKAATPPAR